MSVTTNGSIHAFPHVAIDGHTIRLQGGLSKRELFAAMAMQGLLAHHGDDDYTPDKIAKYAVEKADALLAELAKDGAS